MNLLNLFGHVGVDLGSRPMSLLGRGYLDSWSINTAEFEDKLIKTDYSSIISSPDLFRIAFCKAFPQEENSTSFKISYSDQKLVVTGDGSVNSIFDQIEKIRRILSDKFQKRENVKLWFIQSCILHYMCSDKSQLMTAYEQPILEYMKKIALVLPKLAELIGAKYKTSIETCSVRTLEIYKRPEDLDVHTYSFKWKQTFQIPPISISLPIDIRQVLYADLKNGDECDCFLLGDGGNSIKAHSLILKLFGGEFFRNLFNSNMKEAQSKTLDLSTYSITTLQAFLDYIYLGGPSFIDRVLKLNSNYELNILELLNFAHVHFLSELESCCINLLILTASTDDAIYILEASDQYKNPKLMELADHLMKKKDKDETNSD